MTRRALERIVEWWVPRLGLAGWRVSVVWDPADANYTLEVGDEATSYRSTHYDEGYLAFDLDRVGASRKHANVVVVHELLHLRTRELEQWVPLLDGIVHRDVLEVVERQHRHGLEGEIDRLANAIVELAAELGELP